MCSCHYILECCVKFSGVKLSIRSFVLLLGWVIFGISQGSESQVNIVYQLKFSSPLDITDFWKTESMGVDVRPCVYEADKLSQIEREEAKIIEDSCEKTGDQWLIPYPWKRRDPKSLPNNRVQAVKKLQATEQRLVKSPEIAKAYQQQVEEMNELKFARKLSDVERKDYKGPVYYVSHHEVLRPKKRRVHQFRWCSVHLLILKATA